MSRKSKVECVLTHPLAKPAAHISDRLNPVAVGLAGLHEDFVLILRKGVFAFAVDLVEQSVDVTLKLFSWRLIELYFRSTPWIRFAFRLEL